MDKTQRVRELVELLNRASRAYYADAEEIMPNIEYDRLYDELSDLEKETGIVLSSSPTQHVGYEVVSELPKERHPSPMLSLDKTKSREELADFLGKQEGLLSWKLDGLTVVLTYEEGTLAEAVTRGNGEIGEVITGNARVFANIPLQIPYGGRLVLRGEAIIRYSDFQRINRDIPDAEARYKNPRNLCSGSVRQLDPSITKERNVHFIAFALVEAEGVDFHNSREQQFLWLRKQGFDTVEYERVDKASVAGAVARFEERIETNDFPSDGLVLIFDDIAYGQSLGTTAKFPRDSIAFKWEDQQEETILRKIEWSTSRTGLINPVAVFDPVELEGTTVSRASVHNISIMESLKLGIGDRIMVYKANMIIPQIAEDLTGSGNIRIPKVCPVCGEKTEIREDNGVRTLYCLNPDCQAKQIKSFTLFVSRDGMNIEGLSEATLEKFIGRGMVKEYADLYHLDRYREEILQMEGFGEKSFDNLQESVERSRKTTPDRLLYALGIPGIGAANARLICGACGQNWERIQSLTREELTKIDGVGGVMAESYVRFFEDPAKKKIVQDVLAEVTMETKEEGTNFLAGLTFVITGSLKGYANREELRRLLENAGAKVTGSVSTKTSYLINNDMASASGKNKKARALGIPVIPEEKVTEWLEKGEIIK